MPKIRILTIFSSSNDAADLMRHIENLEFDVTVERLDTADAMSDALARGRWDIVFCDLTIPAFPISEALDILTVTAPEIPLIAFSDATAEDRMVETIKAGAFDVLGKDDLSRTEAILDRAMVEKISRVEKKTLQKTLRKLVDESETRFQTLVETLPEAIIIYDADGEIVFANSSSKKILKASNDADIIGKPFAQFIDPDDVSRLNERFKDVFETGCAAPAGEHIRVALDGSSIPVEASLTRIQWLGNPAALSVARDITERKEAFDRIQKSETYARAVMENAADGVVIIDEDGIIQNFNRAAQNMFGYAEDEVAGKNVTCLMRKKEAGMHDAVLARFLTKDHSRQNTMSVRQLFGRRKDGTILPIEVTLTETRAADSRIIISSVRDITERQLAEQALRESEESFRMTFETAPHGMALVTRDRRYQQVNKALCTLLGYDRDELVGLKCRTLIHSDDLDGLVGKMSKLWVGDIPMCQREVRYIRKDGSIIWAMLNATIVHDRDGGFLHCITQYYDLTATKVAEDKRREMENQISHAQKMEALGTLSGGIAHEFNNMLLPVAGLIELSLDEVGENPVLRGNLEKAHENTLRAAGLVNKILSFSHVEENQQEIVDVKTVVEDAGTLLEATIPSTITIKWRLTDVGRASIDITQIRQIILNLGINAMHAIDADVGQITIGLQAIELQESRVMTSGQLAPGHYAGLSVQDTGCGMDEETVSRIFEPFFTTKDVGEGTGMGLAFVHNVAATHGGAIDVESQPGIGTTFHIYFPLETEAPSLMAAEAMA